MYENSSIEKNWEKGPKGYCKYISNSELKLFERVCLPIQLNMGVGGRGRSKLILITFLFISEVIESYDDL